MQWFRLVVTSAVVMGISQTISKERIFEPLRRVLGGKQTWCGYLVSCPYCASHWVAFIIGPLTGANYVPVAVQWGWGTVLLRWFFNAILLTVVAAFLRVGFWFVDESQGLVRRRQRTEEKTKELVETQAETLARTNGAEAAGPAGAGVQERPDRAH